MRLGAEMKRIIVLGALLLPVVTVYGASSRFFASGVQRSNYWRSEAVFTTGEEITFTSGEDEHTAPVEIEELLIDEQAEPVEIDEEAEQSAEEIEDELTTGEPAEEVSQ